jgi:purine-binding chemotaxis protein CheW
MESDIQSVTGQYLTFRLDGELFAADVVKVREVLEPVAITHVPQTPEYLLGVINLRGNVVPVIDLRNRFGMPAQELTKHSCIIVVEIDIESELLVIGLLADNVQEVVNIELDRIGSSPRLGTRLHTDYLAGVTQLGNEFVLLLNLDQVLIGEESFLLPDTISP